VSPSLLERLIRTPGLDLERRLTSLRHVTIIGEVVPSALVGEFHSVAPACTLTHAYGCAETHDAASTPLTTSDPGLVAGRVAPVGHPQINQRIYVLDDDREPCPRGVVGEIHVGGDSLAIGYHGDPDNTARRFVPDPVAPRRGRVFRTGDRGRIMPDGSLQVLGRLDAMVKLRGYSVTLSAVEAALLAHPAICNAVVVAAVDDTTGRPDHLVAYVVGCDEAVPDDLRTFLADRLPHYAVPAFAVPMDALPVDRRSNSKVDRQGLPDPQPQHRMLASTDRRHPRNEREAAVLDAWRTVLDTDEMGIDDNFFALGGHSLLAAELCVRLNLQFGSELRVAEILSEPTVARIAERISRAHARPA
jgi:acyl-coenzyme A synthetase/AMP-(fatty) acid ligase/acyl carrier protein